MSFFSGSVFSKTLNMDTSMAVILPQDSRKHRGLLKLHGGVVARDIPKTIILLHGYGGNWAEWAHRTSILRYAEDYDVAVLIPEVQKSFYNNMVYGQRYFDYITQELPELAAGMFNISVKPEDLMIAGISMGGYGALKCGLGCPERFMGIGAFSSGCDIKAIVERNKSGAESKEFNGADRDMKSIFGENLEVPQQSDIKYLVQKAAASAKKPRIFMTCGTDDSLVYGMNAELRDFIRRYPFDFRYEEWPGDHEWSVWDVSIQMMLEHLLV